MSAPTPPRINLMSEDGFRAALTNLQGKADK
jgi:hypothetical protein